ncbi:MAG: ATP phosphoribosyltransferase regulatory subunit [Pseudonocardiaceae bacterium]
MATTARHLDLPRGFHDGDPARMATYRALQEQWFAACALAGYQPVHVPPVGFADTFTVGHHAAGEKLYRFADRRGRELALVSDSLPVLLRVAHTRDLPEQRLSFSCPIFRYERRPRRHFHHLGLIEIHQESTALAAQQRATTRLARIIIEFLAYQRLPVAFTVTDPGLWHTLVATCQPPHQITSTLNALRALASDQRPAYLHQFGAPRTLIAIAEFLATDPALTDATHGSPTAPELSPAVRERITGCHEIAESLRQHGGAATVDLGELHASEFHDGPSFLFRPQGHQRLLGDGGSYGLFASAFLGSTTTAHSAVVGLERLADLTEDDTHIEPAADIAVLARPDPACLAHADRLAKACRSAGIAVWDLTLTKPVSKHLRDLAALAIPYSLLIGPRELERTHYTVRDDTGALQTVARDHLVDWLTDRRPSRRRHSAPW